MTNTQSSLSSTKLILRGIHLGLTAAMKAAIEAKAARLFRHEPRLLRVRIDVEPDHPGRNRHFVAKGIIEIAGPDLCASTVSTDAYNSIDLLIDKLDRLLRKRATAKLKRRTRDDIRAHLTPAFAS